MPPASDFRIRCVLLEPRKNPHQRHLLRLPSFGCPHPLHHFFSLLLHSPFESRKCLPPSGDGSLLARRSWPGGARLVPQTMKERQRWQPEEDELLRNYVEQYGAKDWGKVSERTGKALDRDAKSCMERWKNYLKPGIKKTPLSQEEKLLVISLQEKYGNKWKKIASEVPGRTAKRLGKWWEVHKEKERKERERERGASLADQSAVNANYNELFKHIAEKLDERQAGSSSSVPAPSPLIPPGPASYLVGSSAMESDPFSPQALYLRHRSTLSIGLSSSSSSMHTPSLPAATPFSLDMEEAKPVEGSSSSRPQPPSVEMQIAPSFPSVPPYLQSRSREASSLPPWMSSLPLSPATASLKGMQETTPAAGSSHKRLGPEDRSRHLSVGLSLASSSTRDGMDESSPNWSHNMGGAAGPRASWYQAPAPAPGRASGGMMEEARTQNVHPRSLEDLIEYWKDLEERSRIWSAQRKEDTWRMKRIKRQMVEEKLAKGRRKAEEIDSQTQALREEHRRYLESLEREYWEKVEMLEREAEAQETRRFDEWIGRQQQLIQEQRRFLEELNRRSEAG
ncbi:hypothetical protein R1sor_012484 [Riccia sorocarpa]|uniref:Asymmetric leaves 1 n=1 Tax=Riccia sorocarpa TaxID=122646 RepID=A0ABD3I494_9MARC